MPPPFRQVNRAQFAQLLQQFQFTRRVNAVHFHHTSLPNHAQFRGHESVVSMFRHHTQERGFRDIAQHITIAPDGTIYLGRNWNLPPASSVGANGTRRAGPFMFETVGNFNVGRDPFTDPQRKTVITVIALVQRKFGLPPSALNFHREFTDTDCPGTSMRKGVIVEAVAQFHAAPDPLADAPAGPLSPEALQADLSPEETGDGSFDLHESLRELEAAEEAGADLGPYETLNEEDTHDEIEGGEAGTEDQPKAPPAPGQDVDEIDAQLERLYEEVERAADVRDEEELGPSVEAGAADAVTPVELPHHSQLPAEQRGMYVRYDAGCPNQHWGTPVTVELALNLARRWRANGHRPTIHFGDISARNFAQTRCHSAHRTGTHLDVDLPGSLPRDPGYNEAKRRSCSALCWYAISLGARRVLFSDSAVAVAVNRLAQENNLSGRVAVRADHDNHFHIEMPLA